MRIHTFALILAVCMSGCIPPAFIRADCQRLRMDGYNVLACNDLAVGQHCARGTRSLISPHKWFPAIADNGKPVDYLPRACFKYRAENFGRKPTLMIGRSHFNCAFHEICHHENPGDPEYCELNIPCLRK